MIFRYRNGNRLTTQLFKGCDPCNQEALLRYFFGANCMKVAELVEFFAWITNGLGAYDVFEMDRKNHLTDPAYINMSIDDSPLVNIWKRNTNVIFFFLLSTGLQQSLIERYNNDCVNRYNEMIGRSV